MPHATSAEFRDTLGVKNHNIVISVYGKKITRSDFLAVDLFKLNVVVRSTSSGAITKHFENHQVGPIKMIIKLECLELRQKQVLL